MKTVSKRDTAFPFKELRKRSPMPFVTAGAVFLLYGILLPIESAWTYLVGAAAALLGYVIGRGVWPDKRIKVELPPNTGDANTDQLLTEARQQMAAIRAANDLIADVTLTQSIDNIEATCRAILSRLEESPDLYGQLRTFLRYFLPTTGKLLDARAAIGQSQSLDEGARRVAERTDRVLPEIERAFAKQLEALDKHKYLDIQVEMDVLEGMIKSNGL